MNGDVVRKLARKLAQVAVTWCGDGVAAVNVGVEEEEEEEEEEKRVLWVVERRVCAICFCSVASSAVNLIA